MAEMARMALSIVSCEASSAADADLSSDSASSRDCWARQARLGEIIIGRRRGRGGLPVRIGRRHGRVLGGGHFGVRAAPLRIVRPVEIDCGAHKQQHHDDRNVSLGFFHSCPPIFQITRPAAF